MASPESILPPPLQPEEVPIPQIVTSWNLPDGDIWYRVDVPHSFYYVDSKIDCGGIIYLHFNQTSKGSIATSCTKCRQSVSVSIASVRLTLRI